MSTSPGTSSSLDQMAEEVFALTVLSWRQRLASKPQTSELSESQFLTLDTLIRSSELLTVGEIQRLEIGRDEVRDARSWDLGLIMEFTSIEALRAYQRHPQHLAVMAFNDPFVAHVASVDFTRTER